MKAEDISEWADSTKNKDYIKDKLRKDIAYLMLPLLEYVERNNIKMFITWRLNNENYGYRWNMNQQDFKNLIKELNQ